MSKNRNRKRKRKPQLTETPVLFMVGDVIKHPKYGVGVIRKVEKNYVDLYDFFYDADFTGKSGDGTKVWLPKAKTEKQTTLLERDGQPWDNGPGCEGPYDHCPATCFGPLGCPAMRD